MRRLSIALALLAALGSAAGLALLAWQRGLNDATPQSSAPASLARGAYLAAVGNCAGCHTARGGARLAGGRPIPTPFGTVFSTNLTPDPTGLAGWSANEFWRALHLGISRDGRLLVPAHPIVNTTLVSREDADALHAWLQAQGPVVAPRRAHQLRWPYGSQLAIAAWRALYFRPGVYQPNPARDAAWNRGAYLSQGLAHCSACHAGRGVLGGDQGAADFRGGLLAGLGWVAPSLHDPAEAGVQRWTAEALQRWLRDGHADGHAALGPMAEVVLGSTAALDEADLAAMSAYLRALPERAVPRPGPAEPDRRRRERGAGLYREHCAACHGGQGEGRRDTGGAPAYPALAGSRVVTQASAANLLRVIERGGFAPATPGHPRPYGMPPFAGVLGAEDLAALASHLRQSFGHQAGEIDAVEVLRLRAAAAAH
ncbi:c-type cytochrome [Roseateles saccharophilus]|uniref:Cbb3-type cytochrome c oxidase subunit III n=1 Tax=Roseateles saccharophilus TaxID=304 RepID=A0A4R3VGL4_ROSSA|nr:cytochrome c [Roseateles saccharophilus]MDG0834391.1 c-type cytochrome [Roseateles saccharophilus]TCV01995.1 cbb3-type cytochrome c oxidase subunit III [Roseateles saccharophilus]